MNQPREMPDDDDAQAWEATQPMSLEDAARSLAAAPARATPAASAAPTAPPAQPVPAASALPAATPTLPTAVAVPGRPANASGRPAEAPPAAQDSIVSILKPLSPIAAAQARLAEAARTTPAPRPEPQAPAPVYIPAMAPETHDALRMVVKGFTSAERRLLEGTVMLSRRRNPRLEVLKDSEVAQADVLLIDGRDETAVRWARQQDGLSQRAVIWVDGRDVPQAHTLQPRPVQWPTLPMLLARALAHTAQALGAAPAMPRPPAPTAHATLAREVTQRAAELAATGVPPGAAAPRPTSPGKPLLVVDDSLAVRAHMRSLLEARGHTVVDADNAAAGLAHIAERDFALVFMDVLMPGTDGYEACRQIKAARRGKAPLPVVMLTSKGSPFDRIRGTMAGCDAYLTKPVSTDELQATLSRLAGADATRTRGQPA